MPNSSDPRPPTSRQPGTALSLVTLAIAASLFVYVLWSRGDLGTGGSRLVTARGDLAVGELTTIEIFDNASQSVVFIRNVPGAVDTTQTPSRGTGILWDSAGHIVTNFHVVSEGGTQTVTLLDGVGYDAEFVGGSVMHDLAVLRIPAALHRLTPLTVGSSHDLLVGQSVYAIGNPFGLDHTLTTGVVSALDRTMRGPGSHRITGVIQTDAAINPGNSGGPLLDSAGRLIGVNTQIYSSISAGSGQAQSAGIGFAIPVDTVNEVVPQLIAHGHVTRPGIGAMLMDHPQGAGSVVRYVVPGGAADRAGLEGMFEPSGRYVVRAGDIIVGIDGTPVRSRTDAIDVLSLRSVGDTVQVQLNRDGRTLSVPVTLMQLD